MTHRDSRERSARHSPAACAGEVKPVIEKELQESFERLPPGAVSVMRSSNPRRFEAL
jgi:hypothetical protein